MSALLSAAAYVDDGWDEQDAADRLGLGVEEVHAYLAGRNAGKAEVLRAVPADDPVSASPDPPRPLYGDVAALLAGGIPEPPAPVLLRRDDGCALLYAGKVNVLFGDPECGKTWIALAAVVEALKAGHRAAVIDLDHNGMAEVVSKLLMLGAKPADLGDLERFRYSEPEDAEDLARVISDLRAWRPGVAVVDSIGEALPMLALSSSSPDDYTRMNRFVMTPLSSAGAAVIGIDHLPKDDAAREKGQTGTAAKRRTVNGVTLRVTVKDAFTPGHGGSANLTIYKDRPGGLRGASPRGKNPPAGRFVMDDDGTGTLSWRITTPTIEAAASGPRVSDDDMAAVLGMPRGDRTKRKIQALLRCGSDRAQVALEKCRELGEQSDGD